MAQMFYTVTDAASVELDGGESKNFSWTIAGARTLATPVNFKNGDTMTLKVIQDGTGGRTITWPSNFVWESGKPPVLKSAASAIDVFQFHYDGTNFRDIGGTGGSRVVQYLAHAGLGLAVLMNVGYTYQLSAGSGTGLAEVGRLPNVQVVKSGTGVGANGGLGSGVTLYTLDGSGSVKVSRHGGVAWGVNAPETDRVDKASNSGSLTVALARLRMPLYVKNTMSAAVVKVGGLGPLNVVCALTGATLGRCIGDMDANGHCDCR